MRSEEEPQIPIQKIFASSFIQILKIAIILNICIYRSEIRKNFTGGIEEEKFLKTQFTHVSTHFLV